MTQTQLFEPTGGELLPLICKQLRKAEQRLIKAAECFRLGRYDEEAEHDRIANLHMQDADELEMLLSLESLGRVH